ncbi:hypothetical protein I7I51_08074 [Histoplasma capsulatum]|uniref:Uncharacterized protein n=1 Tax=Ajellomyces capsulatus TaxID=5037 RepID=A0A8A1LWX1_AJECA|nr:hypothetical protein I7I51_08074 [Histoplasma capsulatum]
MDVSPASVSDNPTAASSSVSEPNDIEASPRGKKLYYEEELENSLAYPFEGTNNVGAAALDDILSLLKPETFNWADDVEDSVDHTSPEVSLFVIVSPPKPLFSGRLMRQAVTLWQAMKFVDPILYRGDWEDLKFSGRELLKAITGQAFQFYTPAGTWQHDTHQPDIQQPIVDPSNPQFYASEKGLPLNGWLTGKEYGGESNTDEN